MSDSRYDAAVLGGGHHGTIIACYLARAGLSLRIGERDFHTHGRRRWRGPPKANRPYKGHGAPSTA